MNIKRKNRISKRFNTCYKISLYILSFSIWFVTYLNEVHGQTKMKKSEMSTTPLRIGDGLPSEFWKKEFVVYNNGIITKTNLESFKGKIFVLDFWSTTCTPCLIHQREIEYFKQNYGSDLKVIMVNSLRTRDNREKIEKLNNSLKNRGLGIDSIYSIIEDDYLHRLFPFNGFPFYVWINQYGNVQTYTMRNLLDRQYFAPFIDPKITNK